jgi:hypothetical protein
MRYQIKEIKSAGGNEIIIEFDDIKEAENFIRNKFENRPSQKPLKIVDTKTNKVSVYCH